MLERDKETRDTIAKMKQLQSRINKHNKEHPMMSFHSGTKRKYGDEDGQGAGGGAGDVGATNCALLKAHGFEVEPREVVDESGFVIMESLSNVRQPLSTYALR
jgi:hypothetical protein